VFQDEGNSIRMHYIKCRKYIFRRIGDAICGGACFTYSNTCNLIIKVLAS